MLLSAARSAQKAEAKYHVVTDYPDLRLHSAASKGNIALVQYALTHGQPVNSVLDGILPIHAAAAGGSEIVVKILLNFGADVNAPRLPLKYSHEKPKSGTTIVGTSGCTALHFAAANGHVHIVRLLLSHGADPQKKDKHGVSPEDLALELGLTAVVDVFRASIARSPTGATSSHPPIPQPQQSPSRSRILKVQRSIDNVFSGRKISSPSTSQTRLDEDAFPSDALFASLPPRRPSLPTLLESYLPHQTLPRKRCNSSGEWIDDRPLSRVAELGQGHQIHDDVPASQRLLSSLAPPAASSVVQPLRKLGSKYSLMSLFKKANESASNPPTMNSPPIRPNELPGHTHSATHDAILHPDAGLLSSIPANSSTLLHHYRVRKKSDVAISSPLASESVITAMDLSRPELENAEDVSPSDHERSRHKSRSLDTEPIKPSTMLASTHHRHTSQPSRALRFKDPLVSPELPSPTFVASRRSSLRPTTHYPHPFDASEIEDDSSRPESSGSVDRVPTAVQDIVREGAGEMMERTHSRAPDPLGDDSGRSRGDSLSSTSDGSSPAQLSASTSSTIDTGATTPSMQGDHFPLSIPSDNRSTPRQAKDRPIITPLALRNVSTHAEAQSLVQQTRNDILTLSKLAPDSPGEKISLAEQLEAYGQTLQLERRFARGEAQRDGKLRAPSTELESEDDDAATDTVGPPSPTSTLGLGSPLHGRRSSRANRSLSRAFSLDQNSSAGRNRNVSASSQVSLVSTSARSRHRPIPNMSAIQHKLSLDARLNRGSDDEEFYVHMDHHEKDEPSTPLAGDIEIIHTLPTPTDSPASTSSALRPSPDILPTFSSPVRSPTPIGPAIEKDRGSSVDPSFQPLSRVFTAPSSTHSDSVTSSLASRMPHESPISSHAVDFADYASSSSHSGKRFGFRHIVQSLKGK